MQLRDAVFDEVHKIISRDKDVMLLTADMGAFGVTRIKDEYPDQFLNVGVAEQNLISVSAGLALGGKMVFAYGIAAFIVYRCLDQIRIDLCEMKLPVTLIGAGAGRTYKTDGATHHAIHDADIMEMFKVAVFTPTDSVMAKQAVQYGYRNRVPTYIRMGR